MGFFSKLFGSKGPKGLKVANVSKRFELQGRTGQGSMSRVFKAFDRDLGRNVCLKLLDKVKTKRFEERFKVMGLKKPPEGEVCCVLSHKNCVKTYEHGITTEGEPYLVMEWIEGLGLNYLIETNSPQLQGNRINYLGQLCDAITYLHGEKYLHRDLCPRNVMVDKDGVLKLIDFGLTIPYTPQFCVPGNRTGTVDYLAPEIIKRMTTDHRVDVFALGVTAYEMFTGSLPWDRSPSSEDTLKRHLNVPPRDPREVKKDMEPDLARVLLKCVDRDRNQRYPSANQFKDAMQKLERQDY
ncbi:MAG: serine/threonine-protein kinase [Gemmataceae bacterium]